MKQEDREALLQANSLGHRVVLIAGSPTRVSWQYPSVDKAQTAAVSMLARFETQAERDLVAPAIYQRETDGTWTEVSTKNP